MARPNPLKVRSVHHLTNILSNTRDHHPNFALLLGAGASVTSGVPAARTLIEEWRRAHYKQYARVGESFDQHCLRAHWFNSTDEYAYLFEALYDQPSQRREFIETCLRNASPSWGYIYLVNLIRNNVFSTVFTTNFDDLISESCYNFSSDVRPIVCAHDSSIKSVRVTSRRPKVVKLHGDFLFDNIKNTVSELESLERNMREKFQQFVAEFGLIVVGYAGNDRTIMDTLQTLLNSDLYFPAGIYWCVRKNSEVSSKVDLLSRYPKFHFVEIDGFDELFADMHDSVQLVLQPEMSNPYQALASRLDCLLKATGTPTETSAHPVIERDIKSLGQKISLFEQASHERRPVIDPTKQNSVRIDMGDSSLEWPIPFHLLAQIQEKEGRFDKAMDYALRGVGSSPQPHELNLVFSLLGKGRLEAHKNTVLELFASNKPVIVKHPFLTQTLAVALILLEDYAEAERVLKKGYELYEVGGGKSEKFLAYQALNMLQIKAHQGVTFDARELTGLGKLAEESDELIRYGALVLLGQREKALELLEEISEKNREQGALMRSWPITKLLNLEDAGATPGLKTSPPGEQGKDLPKLPSAEA